nr:hypothetical protein [Ancylobacter oerskovii]
MMRRPNLARVLAAASLLLALAGSAHWLLPLGREAFALLMARDDAARLADLRLDAELTAGRANREIDEALANDDAELAASFLELADSRALPVPADRRARVLAAASAGTVRQAAAFGRGFVTGEADDLAGLAGATAGDLTVWGDVRDLGRQAGHYLRDEPIDPLMTGLAGAGIAATAATYAAFGTPLTLRAGLSLAKGARRVGAVGLRLGDDLAGLLRSGRHARAIAAVADIGRAGEKAGVRATLAGLRHADDVTDVARLRRLSEAKGGQTLAVLKTLGRGALVLGEIAARLAFWVIAAAANFLGLVAGINNMMVALCRPLWRRRDGRRLQPA